MLMFSLNLFGIFASFSVPAQGADDLRVFAVENSDVVSEMVTECHVMAAIELEFPAFEGLDEILYWLVVLVELLLLPCHGLFPPNKKRAPQGALFSN